ncbi:MAG: hypothetical protein ABW321_25165 [Polyangiales bacterium]
MDPIATSRARCIAQNWCVPLACGVIALLRRSGGWDPASLWLDDQWVALALREASFSQLVALHIPAPLGFVALQKLIAPLTRDPEWPLQLVPMLAGLAAIPVFYAVLGRVVRQRGVLAVACLAAACHSTAELYSVRVKHYTLDLLLVIALLGGTIALLHKPGAQRLGWLVLGSFVAAVFSFTTLFVSLCCLHALWLDRALRSRNAGLVYGAWVAGFDLAVAGLYAGLLCHQSNDAMRAFWQKYFLHFDSADSVLAFAYHGLGGFALHALSPYLIVLLALVPIGVRALARDPVLRPLCWISGALLVGLVAAAALQLYPFGPERTSLFAFPVPWLLAAVGGERVWAEIGSSRLQRHAARLVVLYVIGVSVLRPRVSYSDVRDRQVVEAAAHWQRPGDVLLTHQLGLLALSYYGQRPVRLVPSRNVTEAFEGRPDWPDLQLLVPPGGRGDLRSDPTLADATLQALVAQAPPHILYLSTHASETVDQHVLQRLTAAGYLPSNSYEPSPGARLIALMPAADGGERISRADAP